MYDMYLLLGLETIYLLVVAVSSMIIFLLTRRLFRFSKYRGISYFSSAFLFLAIGFLLRYLVMALKILGGSTNTIQTFGPLTLIMEFFLILPGFFLLYSMVWRTFEKVHFTKKHSIYSFAIYCSAFLIAVIDMLMQDFLVMYSSQVLVFLAASGVGWVRYRNRPNNFMQLLFISMVLFLIVWIINFIAQYTIDALPMMRLYAYLFTVGAVALLLFISIRLTSDFK